MIFGAHNWYHNGGSIDGLSTGPDGSFIFAENPVKITDKGIVILNLHEHLNVDEKLRLMAALDDRLRTEYGSGFAFATTQISDCFQLGEQPTFFQGIKSIDPKISGIFIDHRGRDGGKNWLYGDVIADHRIEINDAPGDQIVSLVKPTEDDRMALAKNKDALSERLHEIYNAELFEIRPDLAESPEKFLERLDRDRRLRGRFLSVDRAKPA